ncbi:PWWP domain-containing protein 2A [Hoplias malabaricus]|uniref:PWWP domain-containing protein 2A n=1 Tax=Hoplias malabaricus TaxID=27720 RepID=UPI0034626E78
MAAVAAEPGAAAAAVAASSAAGDESEYEPRPVPVEHAAALQGQQARDFDPETELCGGAADVDVVEVEECRRIEMRRPELLGAGKEAPHGHEVLWSLEEPTQEPGLSDCTCTVSEERLKEPLSPSVLTENEVSVQESSPCLLSGSAPLPSAVFLHTLPARRPLNLDTGLSQAEPLVEYLVDPQSDSIGLIQPTRGANLEPEAANDAPGSEFKPPEDAFHETPSDRPEYPFTLDETSLGQSDFSNGSSNSSAELPLEPAEALEQSVISSESQDPVLSLKTDLSEHEPELEPETVLEPELQPETVLEPELQPETVLEPGLQPETVLEPELQPETVLEPELQPETVLEPGLQPETVLEPGLQPESVLEPGLQPESVLEPGLQPESVLEPELQPESVLEPELQPESVLEPELQPESVLEPELQPESVLEPELQPESVLEPELQPESVPEQELQPESVLEPELQPETVLEPEPEPERHLVPETELETKPEPGLKSQVPVAQGGERQSDSAVMGLIPGSEVRVTLDHIIEDALVVSFRLGEKIFSGVLMDLSKRFGPYGIPITVFPKREYKDKPETMQLKTEAFQSETEKGITQGTPDAPPKEPTQTPSVPQDSPNPQLSPWTSKPPPLFQEGAPYPPPLFIRDTYNQTLPQPLPRKIKRPKRRLYREEPTSIMNAIKLRPRQVLCDKCKGAVVQGDKRETRRGPISDCRNDDAKRRRNDSAAPGKRPRSEDRSRAADGHKRQAAAIRVNSSSASSGLGHSQVKGAAAANRVVRGVSTAAPSSANSSSRVQLNAKKVLQSKNVDHSKAREVLKMAKAQRRQRETVTATNSSSSNTKAMTRAAALQEAHQKVHFTRRLQQISAGGPGMANPLPPRMRIKPQRYRNEENDSSSCRPPCLEKVPGGGRLTLPKVAGARCTSTRSSSSSSSCSTGQAAAATEPQGPDRVLEPPLSQQAQPKPQPHPPPEHRDPQLEPEEQEGRGTRGSKAGNLVVYMTLNPSQPDSSSTSMCSVDSADDLKSSNSECSSTETLDFPPPGDFRTTPAPGTSSSLASTSPSAPKDEKKCSKSLKATVFSKNVSKCVALDGRTICVGDIVWAKILGFPWWPARILAITVSRKDNGLLVRQEARVSWFGSPTTSFLAITQLAPFLENFQSRFDKKRKGLYRKAITEAAKAAKQLTPEVRALLTQFET